MNIPTALLLALAIWALGIIFIYNRLVVFRNRVDNAWAQIDVQLKRRYDLIPNLVKTVQAYAAHEKEVFQNIAEARSQAFNARTVNEQGKAENGLTKALGRLIALAEGYPQLKANENFLLLQEELVGTEGKIAYARQFYNDSVMALNTKIQLFPHNLLANLFGFKQRDYLEIDGLAKDPVNINFQEQ